DRRGGGDRERARRAPRHTPAAGVEAPGGPEGGGARTRAAPGQVALLQRRRTRPQAGPRVAGALQRHLERAARPARRRGGGARGGRAMTVKQNRKGCATITVVSDTAYEVERKFDASAQAVFRALTEPELIKRWWGFPSGRWVECVADVRPGGRWRNAVIDQGQEVFFHGRYHEVDRPRRLVNTEVYEGVPGGGPDVDEPSTPV